MKNKPQRLVRILVDGKFICLINWEDQEYIAIDDEILIQDDKYDERYNEMKVVGWTIWDNNCVEIRLKGWN